MKLKSAGYSVYFEKGPFSYLNGFLRENSFSSVFILCDTNTKRDCLPALLKKTSGLKKAKVFVIPAGERGKNIETVNKVWDFLLESDADRNSLFISVGGGVVCDLGGFAASTFKRGINFIHIPTTLLAMADASVGGKTGVDFKGYKNLIGTIMQPQGVFINEIFLKSLPARQTKNGIAEIIKAALIANPALWKRFLAVKNISGINVTQFIQDSVVVKNEIVKKDPNEKNIRKILNFGHTAGHAIESYYLTKKNSFLHGEAIVMGMCVELCLGKILGITAAKSVMEAFLFMKGNYHLRSFSSSEISAFMKLMQHDKKNSNGRLNFALIEKPGHAVINISATANEVKEAFILYNNLLK
ncbi:MAG: 3-dehydroquinate synthase [Bacteroidia bacterium]